MDTLVDIFYYDFILTKIIEMYHEDKPLQLLYPYLKIATVLSKKFRDEKIPVDKQVYIKEVYVKVVQVIKHCISETSKDFKSQTKLIDCIKGVLAEENELERDPEFIVVRTVAFVIFENQKQSNDEETTKYLEYIKKSNETLDVNQKLQYDKLFKFFDSNDLLSYLKTVKLGNPIMKKFASVIKNGIDEEEKITKRDSSGEKLTW